MVKTCLLEKNKETNEIVLELDPEITKHLKPHQVDGITFMFDSTFEMVEKGGTIKTLQVHNPYLVLGNDGDGDGEGDV